MPQKNFNSSKSNTSSFRERDGGGEPLDQQTEVRMPDSGGGDDIQGSGDPLKGLNVTKGQRHGVGGGGGEDDTPTAIKTAAMFDGGGDDDTPTAIKTMAMIVDGGDDEGPSTLLNTSEDEGLAEQSEVAPDLEIDADTEIDIEELDVDAV